MASVLADEHTRNRVAQLLDGEFDKIELMKVAVQLIIEEPWRPKSP